MGAKEQVTAAQGWHRHGCPGHRPPEFVHVEHRGTASLFVISERGIECLPSAAELVMGEVETGALPAPRPGATSRRARREARRQAVTTLGT